MNQAVFNMAFWHPLGPHARESVEQIIERKRQEIQINGWTLWSFQYRRTQVLDEWRSHLMSAAESTVKVFCSHSPKAVDPAVVGVPVEAVECRSYRFAGQTLWQPWPTGIKVLHAFRGRRTQASAFVVDRIIHPVESFSPQAIEWMSQGQWRQDRLPTRGEYLIRPGGTNPMRQVRAVLELRSPYLAEVSADARARQIS